MTARDTSIAAFAGIKPTLSDRQSAVYALLQANHAMTNSEIARALGWTVNTVTPRTFELRAFGLVKDCGKRRCKVTGRSAYQWGIGKGEARRIKEKLVPQVVFKDGVRMVRLVPEPLSELS